MPYKDKEKQRQFQREWCAKRRREYFDGKVCVKCQSPYELELDHINPATKVHHCIWSWSKPRREAELAKCQPLCHDCHVTKSIKDRSFQRHYKRAA